MIMAKSGSKSVTVTSWDTLKFSWWFDDDDQSVENNTTLVRWKLELIATSSGRIDSTASKNWSVTVNGKTYKGTNKVGISNNSTKTLASGTTPIEHDSDGSKTFSYSFSQQFSITFSGSSIGTKSGSGTGTLDTIPRKSTLSVANGTLGTALTLTVTREFASFTHSIKAVCGSSTFYIKADGTTSTSEVKHSDTSIPFTPPLSLASQNTTGTSVSITYTITTYNGSTNLGSNSYTITCSIPSSVKPSVSLSVTDEMGYADTFGGYVQGKSKFKITVTASESYGSPIKTYKTTADGKTYTAATITTGVISGKGTLTISVTVTDSRGRTATASETVTVLAYSSPTISALKCFRTDAEGNASSTGEYLAIAFDSSITSLNNKNSASYELQYKKVTEDQYTTKPMTDFTGQYSVSGGVFVFPADKSSSYNIVLAVFDAFGDVKKAGSGASIKKWFSILKSVFGFAIGKIAELPNVFDIALQTRFTGGILHPVLEPDTDLNDVTTPNTYVGENVSTYKYLNCPITSGTFNLEVVGGGDEGQVQQTLTYTSNTEFKVYHRQFHSGAWGDWFNTYSAKGNVLTNPLSVCPAGVSFPFAKNQKISEQPHGIVLVFSRYENDTFHNDNFATFFYPKYLVDAVSGAGVNFFITHSKFEYCGAKYLYIYDDKITGHANNELSGTGANGITYNNARWCLRWVIGV
jgi:hypothetical protein